MDCPDRQAGWPLHRGVVLQELRGAGPVWLLRLFWISASSVRADQPAEPSKVPTATAGRPLKGNIVAADSHHSCRAIAAPAVAGWPGLTVAHLLQMSLVWQWAPDRSRLSFQELKPSWLLVRWIWRIWIPVPLVWLLREALTDYRDRLVRLDRGRSRGREGSTHRPGAIHQRPDWYFDRLNLCLSRNRPSRSRP